jgi:hypothetical protein
MPVRRRKSAPPALEIGKNSIPTFLTKRIQFSGKKTLKVHFILRPLILQVR